MKKTTLLIMAAGMGSRFGSLKQIEPLGPYKKGILHYTIHDAVQAGFSKIVFIIRESFAEEFRQFVGKYAESLVETHYCFQDMDKLPCGMPPIKREKPWGTAHAIWSAKDVINEPFAAINADDFYGSDAYVKAYDFLTNNCNDAESAMIGYKLDMTLSENGSVSRGVCVEDANHELRNVDEVKTITWGDDRSIFDIETKRQFRGDEIVSMNFWCLKPGIFAEIERQFSEFYPLNKDNLKSEFYIPLVVDQMIKSGRCVVKVIPTSAKWYGVTYKEDKAIMDGVLVEFHNKGLYSKL